MKIFLVILVTAVVGTLVFLASRDLLKSQTFQNNQEAAENDLNPSAYVAPEASIVLVNKSQQGTTANFDVVYRGGEVKNVQGIQFMFKVSPRAVNIASSTVKINPEIVKDGMNTILSKVTSNPREGRDEVWFMAGRKNIDGEVNLSDGAILASVQLVFSKEGSFTGSVDSSETKIIYGNVLPMKITAEESIWTITK